ncbi:MAG: glycosyltransferase family 4 protein [Acidobacteriota bacterium]
MRILILTQWYPPEPALLLQELAHTLLGLGHDVTVLTGYPNYPTGDLYPGYRVRFCQREVVAGVPVVRVPLYPDHSRSSTRRFLNYLSFAISSSLLAPWLVDAPDVIFAYHPPLTIGLPAILLGRFWRVPFVYQVQDLWPETLAATGMLNNRRILNWVGRFAHCVYVRAHTILVISPGFKSNLVQKAVPESKIQFIPNWVDTETYRPVEPDPDWARDLGLSERFNVMFAGNIGEAQGLETVIEAARLLRDLRDVQWVIIGDGIALRKLKDSVREYGLDNVRFLGRRRADEMSKLYALADVLLVHLKDDPLFRITIPHKTLAYLAVGKPILVAVAGNTAEFVTGEGAGVACPPSDPAGLAATVESLRQVDRRELERMGAAGLLAAKTKYSRMRIISQIEGVLRSAIKREADQCTVASESGR